MANQIIVTKQLVHEIFDKRLDGQTPEQIAKHYPFSSWTVREILKRQKGQEFTLEPEHIKAIIKPPLVNGTHQRIAKPTQHDKREIIDGVVALVEAKRDFQRAIINALKAGLTKAEVNRVIHPLMEKEK